MMCPLRVSPSALLMNPSLGAYWSSQMKPTTTRASTTGRKKMLW